VVDLPQKTDLLNAVFATEVGVENDPLDAKDEGLIWYEVLGITPQQLKPFDQVKDEVQQDWSLEEQRTRLAKYTDDLVKQLQAGKTLEDLAKELNTQVLPTEPLKRNGLTVNVLPAAVTQAFALGQGGYGSAPRAWTRAASCFRWTRSRRLPPRSSEPRCLEAPAQGLCRRGHHRRIFLCTPGALRRDHQPAGARQARRWQRRAMSPAQATSVTPLPQQGGAPIEPDFATFACLYDAGIAQVAWTRLVADLETPVSAMLKLAHERPNSFLLESVEGGAARGRYSIIGCEPDLILRANGARAELNRAPQADASAFAPSPLPTFSRCVRCWQSRRSSFRRSCRRWPPAFSAIWATTR